MEQNTVSTTYNDKGTIIMEMLYGEPEYLSPGGDAKTQALIDLARLDRGLHVLDVGSGLGGSAFYLAQEQACRVHGIDLMASNAAEAKRRAGLKILQGQVDFISGDAVALPFSDQRFDVVWGQDAWCHVDDKATLIAEVKRVLVEGGQIVFSDWLVNKPGHIRASELYEVAASANMASLEMYQDLIRGEGLHIEACLDTSDDLRKEYHHVLARLRAFETSIVEQYGQKVFDIVLSTQQYMFDACEEGLLGSGSLVAKKL